MRTVWSGSTLLSNRLCKVQTVWNIPKLKKKNIVVLIFSYERKEIETAIDNWAIGVWIIEVLLYLSYNMRKYT